MGEPKGANTNPLREFSL